MTCLLVRFFIAQFSILPFRVIYWFSDITFLFLFHLIRYRRRVVSENLKLSFPEKNKEELKILERSFYRHFSDIILETLKAFSMDNGEMTDRYRVLNPEILDPYFSEKRSVIAVAGHFNNWEWGSVSACLQLRHHPVGFYKPIKNTCIDNYIRENRERNGTSIVSISHTTDSFQEYKNTPSLFMMVADQSPSKIELAHWTPFLNRETAFLHGPEKHARLNDLPVVYVDIQKKERGYYTVTFKLLTDNPSGVPEKGITRMFAEELEKSIRKNPHQWLWSHRRWKHKKSL